MSMPSFAALPCHLRRAFSLPVARTAAPSALLAQAMRAFAVAGLVLLSACASTRGVGDPNTPTGGVAVEVESRDSESLKISLYRVWPDGTIDWGGGRDAMNSVTTWEGLMGQSEIASMRQLLEQDGWYDGRPKGSGTPKTATATVVVKSAAGSRTTTIRGSSPELERLLEVLRQATKGRHDGYMRKLPDAAPRLEEPDPRTDQM